MRKGYMSFRKWSHIYSKVPRLCVDIVIIKNKKVLLTKRSINPFRGLWHLPGGGVLFKEKISDAVSRVAKVELGIRAKPIEFLDYYEFLKDGPRRHSVVLAFKCRMLGKKEPQTLEQANEYKFFNKIPPKTISQQGKFLRSYLKNLRD